MYWSRRLHLLTLMLGLSSATLILPGCPSPEEAEKSEAGPSVRADAGGVELHVEALGDGERGTGSAADPYRSLQDAIDAAPDGAKLIIHRGNHNATPMDYQDPGCGNCSDADYASGAQATRGFLVQGKALHLEGTHRNLVRLVTGAGYGLLFIDAGESTVRSLTVTGGRRDPDPQATNAGIVVRGTNLLVENVAVVGNDHLYTGPEPDPVVGVGGIFGREGAILTILDSIIEDNSWDGITLYRGEPGRPDREPQATVEGCRIGCNSQCVVKGGRGAGIGVTWGSQLTAIGNVIHHYWKGIGSFGNSRVYLANNVIRDQHGWGVIASGTSTMEAYNNVIVRNGTTGLAAWNAGIRGRFANNIIAGNGIAADEWVGIKTGIWFNANAATFQLDHNLVYNNQNFDVCRGGEPGNSNNPCQALEFEPGSGNLLGDPRFVSDEDFHLQAGSPAIDSGAADLDDDGESWETDEDDRDPDGSRSDMGLYGGPDAPSWMP